MIIHINQQKLAIGHKYKIYTDSVQTHHAASKLFRWMSEIQLFAEGDIHPDYVIKRRLAWFKIAFDFTRADGQVYELRTISFWKRHYFCDAGMDRYEIFGHRGRKYSVFKNDQQIAWWTKEAVTWFNGDNYTITANNKSDAELLMCFCLAIDQAVSQRNKGAVNINVGSIGPQARKFDDSWQPV